MKNLTYVLIFAAILLTSFDVAAQDSGHPHLYFDKAGMYALRDRIRNNPRLAKLWRTYKKYRIDKEAMQVEVPPGPMTSDLSDGRNYGNALAELTIAYIATGEQRYVDKAKEIALAVAEKPGWGNQLIVAHIDIGLAFCWDVMYDYFSAGEKNRILKAVRSNGRTHINSNQLSNHNWTPSAGQGLIGLAFAGDGSSGFNKDMRALLNAAKQNFKEGDRSVLWAHGTDGFSPQGPGYWRKYNHMTLFMHAVRFNEPGNDWFHLGKEYPGSEFLKNSGYPRIYGNVQHPDLAMISWNDAQVIGGSKPGPYGNISSMIFAASEYKDSYVMDFVDFLLFEANVRVEEEDAAGFILFNDENIPKKSYRDLPLSRYFPDMEAAIFRSGWDKDDLVFFMRCSPPAGHVRTIKRLKPDQHNHPDANGFTLFFNNDYLAAEDGHKPQTGPDAHKIITYGHNTILIDGKGQKGDKGTRVRTTTSNMDYLDAPHVGYLLGDASSAYHNLDRFYRYAIYKKHKYIIIVDELKDDTSHDYEFLLGTDRRHSIRSSKNNTFQVLPDRGSAKLPIVFVEPQNIKSSIKRERAQVFGTATVDLLRVATTKRVKETNFFAMLYPRKKNQGDPSYSKIYDGQRSGIQVDGNEYILYNKDEGALYSYGNVTTDARLCYFKDDSTEFEYLAAGSKSFKYKSVFGVEASKALVAAFKGRIGKIRLGKNLGEDGEARITLFHPGATGVLVDGQLFPIESRSFGRITFRLSPKQYKIGPTGFEQTVTDNYQVEILTGPQQPFVRLTAPNGGEAWTVGSRQSITWSWSGAFSSVRLEYSTDRGLTWETIASEAPNAGRFEWIVPNLPGNEALIRVSIPAGGLSDASDNTFAIVAAPTPTIASFSPDSGSVNTPVALMGENLHLVQSVSFNSIDASFEINSPQKITAQVPKGATTGKIQLGSVAGAITSSSSFMVVTPSIGLPLITGFTPRSGPVGTVVTISGDYLETTQEIKFGEVMADSFFISPEDRIIVEVPAKASTGVITITGESGGARSKELFEVSTGESGPQTLSFSATDDSFVWSKKPTNNYAKWKELRVRRPSGSEVISYLKFIISGISGEVGEAKLRLQVIDASDFGGAIHTVSNYFKDTQTAWSEEELIWTNAPRAGPELATAGPVKLGETVEFDLTGHIAGDGIYSFAITSNSNDALRFAPKDLAGALAPQLVVTTTGQSAPVIESFTPEEGPPGTAVTLAGNHFAGDLSVTFGDVAVDGVVIASKTELHLIVPDSAISAPIVLTNLAGTTRSSKEFVVIPEEQADSQSHTFIPTDDASAWAKKPAANYGDFPEIRVRHSNRARAVSYFKFLVSGLTGPISKATLDFLVTDGSNDGGSVYVVSNNFLNSEVAWTEAELNWLNAPALDRGPLGAGGAVKPGDVIEFDVTTVMVASGEISFALANSSADALMVSAKEGQRAPRLTIWTETADPSLARRSDYGKQAEKPPALPSTLRLFPNYPNPFNPETSFRYSLPEAAEVRLKVYNLLGYEVRTLIDQFQPPGLKTARWDGRDNLGQPVSSGVYFARLWIGSRVTVQKLLLQK